MKRKTRVVYEGPFWRVKLLHCDRWIVLRGLYTTREEARAAARFEAIN